ncbi:hypothetical protein D6D24_02555 [Aureobasidium pullulans]|uniref:Rhodopsin domain-containing protein n=1 Tax=Aureobasidium pullulans TaxID=5580 RepID=A0A4S9F444_AURPU|nr:hypothetical protein D6D24_02555 [Aureobasidium pullulans]THX42082.1 hypothetical protein D6D10_02217 [Aureobasidium pullulans]
MSQIPQYSIEAGKLELMRALNGTFLAISCILVALRVWTRTKISRCWGWDDWFILLALAIFIGECTVWLMLADVESKPASLANLEIYAELICAEQALYIAGTVVLKISLAFFFLRFLIVRWARYVVWISVVVYATVATMMFFLVVFECGIPGNYVMKQATGKCVSFRILSITGYIHGGLNALTDWVFPVLAIHFLIQTKMSRAAKASCCGILLLAVVGSIASIVRTVYIPEIGPGGNIYSRSMKPLIWTMIEGALGTIAASLATLRPLFQRCSARTKIVLQSRSTCDRSTSKLCKSSLGSTLNCFGSTKTAADSPPDSEAEKHDTMDLESGDQARTMSKPLHLGVLSSVATETELNMTNKMDTRTMVRGTKSGF